MNHTKWIILSLLLLTALLIGCPRPDEGGGEPEVPTVYWTDYDNEVIKSINADGTGANTVISSTGLAPTALDVYDGKVYWALEGNETIMRANLNDTGEEEVGGDDGGNVYGLVVDETNNKFIWTNATDNRVRRANIDGSGIDEVDFLTPSDTSPTAMAIGGGKIYYFTETNTRIYRANLDGTSEEVVVSNYGENIYAIAYDGDNNKLYLPDAGSVINQVDLSGSLPATPTVLLDSADVDTPIALAYAHGVLIWANGNDGDPANQNLNAAPLSDLTDVTTLNSDTSNKSAIVAK